MDEIPLILLVEDNDSHALLAIRGLDQHPAKHQIIHISDGEAALDYLFRRNEYARNTARSRPKLILLDLRLPKIDGLDVLREIKGSEDLRLIPVVVLTSSMAEPDVLRAYEFGANSYLVKPFDFEEFRKQMFDLASYWLRWNIYPL